MLKFNINLVFMWTFLQISDYAMDYLDRMLSRSFLFYHEDDASTNKSQTLVHCGFPYVCLRHSFSIDKENNWMKGQQRKFSRAKDYKLH